MVFMFAWKNHGGGGRSCSASIYMYYLRIGFPGLLQYNLPGSRGRDKFTSLHLPFNCETLLNISSPYNVVHCRQHESTGKFQKLL